MRKSAPGEQRTPAGATHLLARQCRPTTLLPRSLLASGALLRVRKYAHEIDAPLFLVPTPSHITEDRLRVPGDSAAAKVAVLVFDRHPLFAERRHDDLSNREESSSAEIDAIVDKLRDRADNAAAISGAAIIEARLPVWPASCMLFGSFGALKLTLGVPLREAGLK